MMDMEGLTHMFSPAESHIPSGTKLKRTLGQYNHHATGLASVEQAFWNGATERKYVYGYVKGGRTYLVATLILH
jgi:hypothetical protein